MRGIRLVAGAFVLAAVALPAPAQAAPAYTFTTTTSVQGTELPVALVEGGWRANAANTAATFAVHARNADPATSVFSADWTSAMVPVGGTALTLGGPGMYRRTTPGNSTLSLQLRFRLDNTGWYPWMPARAIFPSELLTGGSFGGSAADVAAPRSWARRKVQWQVRLEGVFTGTDELEYEIRFGAAGAKG